jgi:hypothetical protein
MIILMMMQMRLACKAIGRWLQRAMVGLAPPPAHNDRKGWTQYYRFPMF